MGRMQLIPRAGSLHQSFGMALGPLPFAYAQGSPCFFDADYAKRLSSRNSSKTFLDEPSQHSWSASTSEASKARNRTVLHVSSNKFSKTFRTRRSLEDVLLSESSSILVSRKRDKQIDMRCCLSEASSSNDYDNRTSGLRAQDVFALFLLVRFSFW